MHLARLLRNSVNVMSVLVLIGLTLELSHAAKRRRLE
jgi:hypothetical protein